MLRIVECAASGVLLVIPDGSHVLQRAESAVLIRHAAYQRKAALKDDPPRLPGHRSRQPA